MPPRAGASRRAVVPPKGSARTRSVPRQQGAGRRRGPPSRCPGRDRLGPPRRGDRRRAAAASRPMAPRRRRPALGAAVGPAERRDGDCAGRRRAAFRARTRLGVGRQGPPLLETAAGVAVIAVAGHAARPFGVRSRQRCRRPCRRHRVWGASSRRASRRPARTTLGRRFGSPRAAPRDRRRRSLPCRFITRPATITVSTLPTCASHTTAPTGLLTGNMFSAVASSMTRSACLPGVSDPVRRSSPQARAPWTVANSRMSRALIGSGSTSLRSRSASRVHHPPRRGQQHAHLGEHVPAHRQHTSMEMLGRQPWRSSCHRHQVAVAHVQLDFRRQRGGAAAVGDQLQLVVGQRVAMHIRGVVGQQPALVAAGRPGGSCPTARRRHAW